MMSLMRVIEILIGRLLREESCSGIMWYNINSSMSAYNLIVLTGLIMLESHEKKMT